MKIAGIVSSTIYSEVMFVFIILLLLNICLILYACFILIALNIEYSQDVKIKILFQGCMEKLVTTLKTQTYHFMGAAILVLALEILSLILALICCCKGGPSDRYKA